MQTRGEGFQKCGRHLMVFPNPEGDVVMADSTEEEEEGEPPVVECAHRATIVDVGGGDHRSRGRRRGQPRG